MSYYTPNLHGSVSINDYNGQYGQHQLYGYGGRYSYSMYESFVDLNSHASWDQQNGYDLQNSYGSQYGHRNYSIGQYCYGQEANKLYNHYRQTVNESCDSHGDLSSQNAWNFLQGPPKSLDDQQHCHNDLSDQNAWNFLQGPPKSSGDQQDCHNLLSERQANIGIGSTMFYEECKDISRAVREELARVASQFRTLKARIQSRQKMMEDWQRHQNYLDHLFETDQILDVQHYPNPSNHLQKDVIVDDQARNWPLSVLSPEVEEYIMDKNLQNVHENDHHMVKCAYDEIIHVDMIVGEKVDLKKPVSAKMQVLAIVVQKSTYGGHDNSAHRKAAMRPSHKHLVGSIRLDLGKFEIHAENTKYSKLGVKHCWPPPFPFGWPT